MVEQKQLSNIQLELLKLYSTELTESDLRSIKPILGEYFAGKASDAMDTVWSEKNLTPEDMIRLAHEHRQ